MPPQLEKLVVVLAPLNERPASTRYPQMLGAVGGVEVPLPPPNARPQAGAG